MGDLCSAIAPDASLLLERVGIFFFFFEEVSLRLDDLDLDRDDDGEGLRGVLGVRFFFFVEELFFFGVFPLFDDDGVLERERERDLGVFFTPFVLGLLAAAVFLFRGLIASLPLFKFNSQTRE